MLERSPSASANGGRQRAAETTERVATDEIGIEAEITVVENPRAFETVVPDFTVETVSAQNVIGIEPKRSLDEAL